MERITAEIRSHPKTVLISSSLIVAVTAFWLTSTRTPEEPVSMNPPEETTYSFEPTGPRLGAAVYFPQGTNPPLLEELVPEVAGDGPVDIEEARWERDEIVAFGTASREGVRCELLDDGVVVPPAESELQTAGDVFLKTFRPRYREGADYSVRCGVSGRATDRLVVSGAPFGVSP